MTEPIFLVIERRPDGREFAQVVHGKPTGRIGDKNSPVVVWRLRIDRLPPNQQEYWLSKSCAELLTCYRWLRDEGTLPPPNLADPTRPAPERSRQFGNWWRQPVVPWDIAKPPEPDYSR